MNKILDVKKLSVHKGPEQSPGFILWRISTFWRATIETVLKSFDLTHPQFVVLATTGWLNSTSKEVTQIMIGTMAGLDPNTNSQIIKGLEKKGLIKRGPSPDGRAKNVFLTTKGSQTLKEALPAVEQTDAQFFDALSNTQTSALITTFKKLINKTAGKEPYHSKSAVLRL